ncbi:MAG: hypothetical protein EAX86_05085 [Candidatus Heimdallarchaeota archaeon]|nr:hypothetical protein [Candidatus Heimdallarchaeota archaeon]
MIHLERKLTPTPLFSIHGELGYFELFQGKIKLPLMILGPRGFGKSELFHLLYQQFNDDYVKFTPVASDGITFQQIGNHELIFYSKGKDISIRGKDGLDWDRKLPVDIKFDKEFRININDMKYGILLVGALGIEKRARQEYREIIHNRGHKINFKSQISLSRINDPQRYLFTLIRDIKINPPYWKQIEVSSSGRLSKIDDEFRLISKIIEYFPTRILELTLPENKNKWGQLNDIFRALVLNMDRLIISSVEYSLSRMIKAKTSDLISQLQHEWRFPKDRQLPDLSGIPEIVMIKSWLENKIRQHKQEKVKVDLPRRVEESIQLGLIGVQTAFLEELGSILRDREKRIQVDELSKVIVANSIIIDDLYSTVSGMIGEKSVLPEIKEQISKTKDEIYSARKFLQDVKEGKI